MKVALLSPARGLAAPALRSPRAARKGDLQKLLGCAPFPVADALRDALASEAAGA